jgi:hypothetical protein
METTITTTSKQDLVQSVKRWTLLDSHLKLLNEKSKNIREERHQISIQICDYLENNNNLKNKRISIHDGEICMYEKKEYSPLTFSYVEECLGKIIPDKKSVDFILQYLKDNREIKKSMDLRRTYNNNNNEA